MYTCDKGLQLTRVFERQIEKFFLKSVVVLLCLFGVGKGILYAKQLNLLMSVGKKILFSDQVDITESLQMEFLFLRLR